VTHRVGHLAGSPGGVGRLPGRRWMILPMLLCVAAGGQAGGPIVDAESGQLYGAANSNGWIEAAQLDATVVASMVFVRYTDAGRHAEQIQLAQAERAETCTNPTYRPADGTAARIGTYVVAGRDASPRFAERLAPDQPTYRAALSQWLAAHGIDDEAPIIAQLLLVDLDGDGTNEVLLAAERHRGSITSTRAGDYAVLLLRRLRDQKVVTTPLRADLYPEDCIAECAPARYRLVSVLDVNGDGRLEMIVASEDYASRGRAIHDLLDPGQPRLSWSCGP